MGNFTFKPAKIYKDEPANKKWCVRFAIKYDHEEKFTYLKDYGRQFFGYSLNSITDLKERDEKFIILKHAIQRNLEDGIDLRNLTSVKSHVETKIKVAKEAEAKKTDKCHFDTCLNLYLQHKGYINPVAKKKQSAQTITMFLKNQFRPYLETNKLLKDIREINKSHLQDFMNAFWQHKDPNLKWSNNTFNNKRSYLGSFFSLLLDEEIITSNPVLLVKSKKKDKTQRFGIFTKEELVILWNYLKENNYLLYVMSKLIYHSFIRSSEATRLRVDAFDMVNRKIRVEAEIAKTQKDGLDRYIMMFLPLHEALTEYLEKYEHEPNWLMFGKGKRPSKFEIGKGWYEDFTTCVQELGKEHPGKFNRDNLTLYCMKHTGVTHFIQDQKDKYSSTELLQFVQSQCRHESFTDTQVYWKRLGFQLDTFDSFKHL